MDVFEEYMSYVGVIEVTDKERLLQSFKNFLDNPHGTFCIRWKENDDLYNNESFDDFYEKTKEYIQKNGRKRVR